MTWIPTTHGGEDRSNWLEGYAAARYGALLSADCKGRPGTPYWFDYHAGWCVGLVLRAHPDLSDAQQRLVHQAPWCGWRRSNLIARPGGKDRRGMHCALAALERKGIVETFRRFYCLRLGIRQEYARVRQSLCCKAPVRLGHIYHLEIGNSGIHHWDGTRQRHTGFDHCGACGRRAHQNVEVVTVRDIMGERPADIVFREFGGK